MADIIIDGVTKEFGAHRALRGVSLEVHDGETVALLGPSGCGKTTLLRIVAGLEGQSAGRVLVGGRDVSALPPRARGLAMVFQNYAVFPHLTVQENVAFGLRMARADAARIRRNVERTAALMHIEDLLARYPSQLSGGQRQRVAVARALAVEPALLLMDEPLSNLDALLRIEMRAELKSVLKGAGTTTLYVTHDQTEAMGLADRIAVMNAGAIEQCDPPMRIYRSPGSVFVGAFVGSPPMNFLRRTAIDGQVRLGRTILAAPRDGNLMLGIRPEDVVMCEPETGFDLDIEVVEPLGAQVLLTGRTDGETIRVAASPDTEAHPGQRLHLRPVIDRICWMDPESGKAIAHGG
jgi:multiple sugar transport system ATP-binding protein